MRLKREKLTDETETHSARKWTRSCTNSVLSGLATQIVGLESVTSEVHDGVVPAVIEDLELKQMKPRTKNECNCYLISGLLRSVSSSQ